MDQNDRIGFGESIFAKAVQYYAGLKGCSIEEARNEFPERLFSDSAIVSSALRLAELEMYHRPVSSVWREIK